MKSCTKCGLTRSDDEFRFRNKNKGTRTCWCKTCFSLYEREKWQSDADRRALNIEHGRVRRSRNRRFLYEYLLTHPCISCGEADPIVLDFDHRDPSEKSMNVSDMIRCLFSLDTLREEIAKCDVLCANCHRRRTARQFGWYKDLVGETGFEPANLPAPNGTLYQAELLSETV